MRTEVIFPSLLDQKQLAEYLGKSIAWCERSRWDGTGPNYIKIGRAVRYRAADVIAWLDANARHNTSHPQGRATQ